MSLNEDFIAMVQRLVTDEGKEVLLDARRCKAILGDYRKGKHEKESRRLQLVLEGGYARAVADAYDVAKVKAEVVQQMQVEEGLSAEAAGELADLLGLVLRGDRTVTVRPQPVQTQVQPPAQSAISSVALNILTQQGRGAPSGFVLVPAGIFQMGSTSGDSDEKPVHSVTLTRGFYMSDHEVTQAEWKAVMGTTPSRFNGDDNPVERVSWYEAVEYCNKLSLKEGRTPAYTIDKAKKDPDNSNSYDDMKWLVSWNEGANGYRLPTEAEWEYAARGGNKSRGYTYSGSNTVGDVAWYVSNSSSKTHPVKTKKANELGIYDLSGNVWEWCWDWYGAYTNGAQTDPTGAGAGSGRVVRGGSWKIDAPDTRAAYRHYCTSDSGSINLGFRVVCF